jgi:DnaJ-class molecular chaperone
MPESDLEYVSKVSGVDFLALREKYKKSNNTSSGTSSSVYATSTSNTSNDNSNADKLGKNVNIDEVLSKYHICKACNGSGIVRTLYNHMTMEKTCEECDGDSIILQEHYDEAVASLHPFDER